ncbi:MAG TPA: DUF4926 domain-containing protein [Cyanobacteria bacterium UBA11149]|nr:DUF4926 domain-containing protein [Cyanobacteria bacterium UBA11367]HBE56880.1 DUF4926 domain-containing protein [Cyanobacteria bacterium UBA11366]HBK63120.1 DUF4926 domain-containing protein [Cyanobacteria bacterium UBA11166]HBR73812.1 DUF4926 domain-containing protein [Cyanobacteria bacterium UBA11159]HBS67585.1 DUF4926 domain-containing protein [Cyanobacteria bacterium UBA11153]HBW88724.1 DUF4926 domain-containing protein [Cyanobacteria bacterium UBA11149]HCA93753.1 DUF4926 domain-conta
MKNIKLLDTIAILNSVPLERLTLVESDYASVESLPSGQVGTVVEVYSKNDSYKYLVEFSDSQGREYAMAILQEDELLVLHYELQVA